MSDKLDKFHAGREIVEKVEKIEVGSPGLSPVEQEREDAAVRDAEKLNLVDCKYLLFLGSGRTGSSVVGQIMNCHPNILVSNESRALQFCFSNDVSLTEISPSVCKEALWDLKHGTRQYDEDDKKEFAKLWQRDWTDISKLGAPPKGDIKYVGDKKQGSNIQMLMANRDKWGTTLDMILVPITVMRNPVDVFASYLALGEDRNNRTIEETINGIYTDMGMGYKFIVENNGLAIRYESLLEDHRKWCTNLCEELKLEVSEEWISVVEKIIVKDKKPLNIDQEAADKFKSNQYYPKLIEMYNSCKF